jgi:hypothetical protein
MSSTATQILQLLFSEIDRTLQLAQYAIQRYAVVGSEFADRSGSAAHDRGDVTRNQMLDALVDRVSRDIRSVDGKQLIGESRAGGVSPSNTTIADIRMRFSFSYALTAEAKSPTLSSGRPFSVQKAAD